MPHLVFDIETITDTSLWTLPKPAAPEEPGACTCVPAPTGLAKHKRGCPSQKKAKPVKAPEDVFAPLHAHRPIAIGMVVLGDDLVLAPNGLGVIGTSMFGDDERALLAAWSTYVEQHRPKLVSFNGRGFDLPVLSLRAMRLGVPMTWYVGDYRHRYNGDHTDLFDYLTDFGAVSRRTGFALDDMAQLIGLASKGDTSSQVGKLWAEKQAAKIEAHCLADVARTAFLFMRASLLRGRITLEQYRLAASTLFNTMMTALGQSSGLFGADPKILMLQD